MKGVKPDKVIWDRINQEILDENAAVVMVTMIDGMCSILVESGAITTREKARVHLAAMLLSPDDGSEPGSLIGELAVELAKLRDRKWIQ